jgi:hypothetical protein
MRAILSAPFAQQAGGPGEDRAAFGGGLAAPDTVNRALRRQAHTIEIGGGGKRKLAQRLAASRD